MVVLDASVVINRLRKQEEVKENITVVTLTEYPKVSGHPLFKGRVYFLTEQDYITAFNVQKESYKRGKPKSFADLIIAAICINRREKLITKDELQGYRRSFRARCRGIEKLIFILPCTTTPLRDGLNASTVP